jgi:hypothetical protein
LLSVLANYDSNVNAMQVYVDGVLQLEDQGPYLMDTFLNLPQGKHRVSVKAWTEGTENYLSASNVTVSAGTRKNHGAVALRRVSNLCSLHGPVWK